MRHSEELWLLDDSAIDEPADLLMIPEIKQYVARELHDDELGLRGLLERPETLGRPFPRRRASSLRMASA